MRVRKYLLVALAVILVDQVSKLLVHHYMYIHQEVNVLGDWFKLHYLLNPGMAFGNGEMTISADGRYLFLATRSGIRELSLPSSTGIASSFAMTCRPRGWRSWRLGA